jgi:hypothetical protein
MRIYKLTALAVAPLFLAGCPGPEEDPMIEDDRVAEERVHQPGDTETLNLGEMHDSGVSGDVRFTVLTERETDVVIEVQDAQPNATYQAAIRQGTCDAVGQQRHALETIQTNEQGDGAASTTLNVQLAQVMDGRHVVTLHGPAARVDRTDVRTDRPATDPDATDPEATEAVPADAPVACGEISEAGTGLGW